MLIQYFYRVQIYIKLQVTNSKKTLKRAKNLTSEWNQK